METWLGSTACSLTCTLNVNHKQLYLQDYDKSTWLPIQWTVARVQIIAVSSIASSFSVFRFPSYFLLTITSMVYQFSSLDYYS